MREVIEKRLRGQFAYDNEGLTFSEQRIELSLEEGGTVEGNFVIYGPQDAAVEGVVSSNELRMTVLTPSFSGAPEEISYRFYAEGLQGTDVLQGYFRIISNQGEYQLPFVISVQRKHIESAVGEIRNLFHFANLARTDFAKAVTLFYDPRFASILNGNDAQYLNLYYGLSKDKNNVQNVEEFLLSVHKKHKTTFLPDQPIIEQMADASDEILLHISRNGWGYTALQVQSDASFLVCEKEWLTQADFIGNSAGLHIPIRKEALHRGHNFGRLYFKNPFTEFQVDVCVTVPDRTGREQDIRHGYYKLFRLYEAFRLKKIDPGVWMEQTKPILSRLTGLDEGNRELRLYRAHFAITGKKRNEAMWLLGEVKREIEEEGDAHLRSYLQYLQLLVEDVPIPEETVKKVEQAFAENPSDWRFAWLLLYLSQTYSENEQERYKLLRLMYENGCRSPFLYIEALELFRKQPAMIARLDTFTRSVFYYGAKKDVIGTELCEQIFHLAGAEREGDRFLFFVLSTLYEKEPMNHRLQVLCELLIRTGRMDEQAYLYYEQAVEQELKITRLYDAYMLSVPMDKSGFLVDELPKPVLMYYAYQNNLGFERAAALYRYLYENREDFPSLYEDYRIQIMAFLREQMQKGRMDESLSVLYKQLITEEMIDKENAHAFLRLLHTTRITVQGNAVDHLIVRYQHIQREREYPISNGEAYVPLYGNAYTIFLADRKGNRYATGISYESEKLILPGKLISYCTPYLNDGQGGIDCFLTEHTGGTPQVDEVDAQRYRGLLDADILTKQARMEVQMALLRFFYEREYRTELAALLPQLSPEDLSSKERMQVLNMLIYAGNYTQAFTWLHQFGTFGVDARSIVRLFHRMEDEDTLSQDAYVTEIAFYAFRKGKYDECLLQFLTAHFQGLLKEMRDIWKASVGFGIDTYRICERILVQMLYSGGYVGDRMLIFKDYVSKKGNAEIESAFLSQCAYDSFVKDRVMEEYIFERIALQHRQGMVLDQICKIAYLNHYAEHGHAGIIPDAQVVEDFLTYLIMEKKVFRFYQEYSETIPQMVLYADKTIVEYKTKPGCRCILHYADAHGMEDRYQRVELKEQYDGVYVTTFTLFFGEQLQYYIAEIFDEHEEVTQSGMLTKNDVAQTYSSGRFHLINDIMIGETLHDYETMYRLMEEFYRKQFLTGQLFSVFEETSIQEENG